jgi:hypothetical protein
MSDQKNLRLAARQHAKALVHVAQRIAAAVSPVAARRAAGQANSIVRKILHALEKADTTSAIEPAVAEDVKATIDALGEVVRDAITPRGYLLMIFGEGRVDYVTNAVRDDVVALMREFIQAHEKGRQAERTPT